MHPLKPFLNYRFRATVCLSLFGLNSALFHPFTQAADYYWDVDGNGPGDGGTGSWNSANWSSTADPVTGTQSTYSSSVANNTFFGGTAGTVTWNTNPGMGTMNLNTGGYTFLMDNNRTFTVSTITGAGHASTLITASSGTRQLTFGGSSALLTYSGSIDNSGGGAVYVNVERGTGTTLRLDGATLTIDRALVKAQRDLEVLTTGLTFQNTSGILDLYNDTKTTLFGTSVPSTSGTPEIRFGRDSSVSLDQILNLTLDGAGSGGALNMSNVDLNLDNRTDATSGITVNAGNYLTSNTGNQVQFRNLEFNNGSGTGSSSGSTIALNSTDDYSYRFNAVSFTDAANIVSGQNLFDFKGNADVHVTGGVSFTGTAAADPTLRLQSSGDYRIDGAIADPTGAATVLVKSGSGQLDLRGASTYTGGTTLSAGATVANNSSGSATGSGDILMNNAATLTLNSGSSIVMGSGTEFVVNSNASFTQSAGSTWTADLFHVNGNGSGTINLASLADSADGDSEMLITFEATGNRVINLTEANPFTGTPYANPTDWGAEWRLALAPDAAMQAGDFVGFTFLTSSGGYDLTDLDGNLNLRSYFTSTANYQDYVGLGSGDTVVLQNGNATSVFTVQFSAGSVELVFGSSRAIPEPSTFGLLILSALVLRFRFRARRG